MEYGTLDGHNTAIDPTQDHTAGDMGRVEDVMGQRCRRILGARRAVHEGNRAECGLADWSACDNQPRTSAERDAPRCRELHEEIVRVLVIGDLQALVRFANLEDLRVTLSVSRERLDGEHRSRAERARSKLMTTARHQPVLRLTLVGNILAIQKPAAIAVMSDTELTTVSP
jgi:hypothetical protein